MKYSEAEKQIKELSSKYNIRMDDENFNVDYKNAIVTRAIRSQRYLFINAADCFNKLPFSDKLYMIMAELAMTPLDERVEEKKYYVKVGDSISSYLNINTVTNKMLMMVGTAYETKFIKTKFTNKDIEELKQSDDIPLDWDKVCFEDAE